MKKIIITLLIVCFAAPVLALDLENGFFLNGRAKLYATDDERYDYRHELGLVFGRKGFPIKFSWAHRMDHADDEYGKNLSYHTYKIIYGVPKLSIFKPEFGVESQRYNNGRHVIRSGIEIRF